MSSDGLWPIAAFLSDEGLDIPLRRFATPAHGLRRSASTALLDISGLERADLAYVPQDVWMESEVKASSSYGTARTFYFPTGASHAVLAAVHATFSPGDRIAVARNAHRSILSAIILLGGEIIWVMPRGPWFSISAADVAATIDAAPSVAGVIVSSPSYEGHLSEIDGIGRLCRERSLRLLVDESLGSHWVRSRGFPPSALACGADAVVHSLHKRAGALVPGAAMHLPRGNSVDGSFAEEMVRMFRSTSPANAVLLDLEFAARDAMICPVNFQSLIAACSRTRVALSTFQAEALTHHDGIAYEPLTLHMLPRHGDPATLAEQAYDRGFDYEHADRRGIVYFVGDDHCADDVAALGACLCDLFSMTEAPKASPFMYERPEMAMAMADALRAPAQVIPVGSSVGRVAAQLIGSCPPGIPILLPGEIVSAWHLPICSQTTIRVVK